MARDITEGRANRSIAVDVGVVSSSAVWQNTDVSYDVAIGGMPFMYAINDQRPYIRETAPFRKDQFDNSAEPGEQSLTGWWIRSQSSFHSGSGIKFYDPSAGEVVNHRFNDSKGVDIWTKGQVTLLSSCTQTHNTTGALRANGRANQNLRSIQWNSTKGVLMHDEYDIDKIAADGTVTHFVDYNAGSSSAVFAMADDGVNAYWVTNTVQGGVNKFHLYKKPLTGSSASTADEVPMFFSTGLVTTNAVMEYVKERLIMVVNNAVYEVPTSSTALPTPLYTHPSSTYVYSSITASGPAVYVSGYNGIKSTIQKFTLSSTGTLPTLTSAITAAELPIGEIVHKIAYYLGYMLIGTNKGIRVANVSDQDGSISYGPLIVETTQPCFDFAMRDRFVWCATSVNGEPGTIRIDLGNEIESLRFAWANDVYYDGVTGHQTTACAFVDGTDRLAFSTTFATTSGYVYIEDESSLRTTGYLKTGNIRFGTLEEKHFERLLARGDYTYGSMTLETVDAAGNEYDHISYDAIVSPVEVTTEPPYSAAEYIAGKFILYRDATDPTKGPKFTGYQMKALIASKRHRILQFPMYCFDVETDRFNTVIGYEGRAYDRLQKLEDLEEGGDVVTWQDLTTGETHQATIEKIQFTRMTPPDKRFDGFGGIIVITVRTL